MSAVEAWRMPSGRLATIDLTQSAEAVEHARQLLREEGAVLVDEEAPEAVAPAAEGEDQNTNAHEGEPIMNQKPAKDSVHSKATRRARAASADPWTVAAAPRIVIDIDDYQEGDARVLARLIHTEDHEEDAVEHQWALPLPGTNRAHYINHNTVDGWRVWPYAPADVMKPAEMERWFRDIRYLEAAYRILQESEELARPSRCAFAWCESTHEGVEDCEYHYCRREVGVWSADGRLRFVHAGLDPVEGLNFEIDCADEWTLMPDEITSEIDDEIGFLVQARRTIEALKKEIGTEAECKAAREGAPA